MKYGFVYIWYDKKHKRYYIGCHWGFEDDGYICSSPWMKQAYTKRPNDFKRRILVRIHTNRQDMFNEEARWHALIKDEELKIRYYNIKRHGDNHWSANPEKYLSVKEKLATAQKRNFEDPEYRARFMETRKKLPPHSDETREKRRLSLLGKNTGKDNSKARLAAVAAIKGKPISDQHKEKIKNAGAFKRINSTKLQCVHCGVVGNPGNIGRYHNDRCKQKLI